MVKKKRLINAIVLVVFIAIEIVLTCINPFKELELYTEDLIYQKPSSVPSDIKIIAIDEKTLEDLGPYNQWDRGYFAQLIDALYTDKSEPRVLAFDVVFAGSNGAESDMALVEAAGKHSNIICASKIEVTSRVQKDNDRYYRSGYVSSEITAFDELSKVTTNAFVTPIFDNDGYTRKAYSLVQSEGKEYVSFALQAARMAGFTGDVPTIYEFLYSGNPGEFETVPMSKVLDGSVPASYFKDSIVLVGAYEEGMMDSYSVPVNHSRNMYGVEIQANEIAAIMNGKILSNMPVYAMVIITVLLTAIAGYIITNKENIKLDSIVALGAIILYVAICYVVFTAFKTKMLLFYLPLGIVLLFIADLVIEYIISQKERADEMQKLLFSMADSMAEAIEGRTPYNANHTKNVAKRSVEMLDYINELHSQKKTDLHFTKNDRKQLYLAAMLHDIGKMDVPTDIMDKPTRLGSKRQALSDRLMLIKLHLMVDELSGIKTKEFVSKEISDIDSFLGKLDSFDCGRPLKEDEVAFIDDLATRVYDDTEGLIPYLTTEELDDLHIKAGTLSDAEREIMKSHVVYTDRILSHIDFGQEFDRVRRMAADHHELINGQGYPSGKKAEDLDVLTRILTIMDIYDSLIADDRPYKKAKPIPVAFDILYEEAEKGKVDRSLLDIAKEMYFKDSDTSKT